MKFYTFLIFLYCFVIEDGYSEIAIQKAGIEAISPGDMGIIFYFFVENKKSCEYTIEVVTKTCKEDNSPECNITLLGNNQKKLEPAETKKLELVWPTLYVHNRKGSCKIIISYCESEGSKSGKHFLKYKVYFDTSIKNKDILPAFKAVYPDVNLKCKFEDQDPLTNCSPVDCVIKYGGCKNFYNKEARQCQSVNSCVYKSKDPHTGYIPTRNVCENIKSRLPMSEVDKIRHIMPKISVSAKSIYPSSKSNNSNSSIVGNCHTNWKDIHGGKTDHHMCNIQVENWKQNYFKRINNTLLVFGILSVLIAIGVLLLTFCCYCLHRFVCTKIVRKRQTTESIYDDGETEECTYNTNLMTGSECD